MTRKIRVSKIVLFLLAILTSACGGGGAAGSKTGESAAAPLESAGIPNPETLLSAEPNPASIDITLEQGSAAKATIGLEGGTLATSDGNGTQYTLTVPEGALFSPIEITMSPIASAEGDVIGDTFLAGVTVEPRGLHFLELVTIEMTGEVIQDGAVGFAAEGDGQDFHMTPSETKPGSLTITTTHFTDFGTAEEALEKLFGDHVPADLKSLIEHELAANSEPLAMATLKKAVGIFKDTGELETFDQWGGWSYNVLFLSQRFFEAVNKYQWNPNTPGMKELLDGMQSLLDQWLQQSEGVVQTLADECQQGKIESMVKVRQILEVGQWLAGEYTLEWDEELGSWEEEALKCHNLNATYKASVITDGTASDGTKLHSDILLGAEADFSALTANPDTPMSTELTVDYIEGFWSGICTPNPGTAELALDVDWTMPNLGIGFGNSLKGIKVYVKFVEQVDIDCSANRFKFSADAQAPFHGGALDRLNEDRESAYGWEFEIEYEPGGGAAGHFEEADDTLTWQQGTYDLWQIITLCQGSC